MKIAVYTIALNEEKHVERWYESAKDADYLLIADTGSTDKTVEIAKKLGINVVTSVIRPFRFDITRNAALSALPSDIDYCISLDMDEVLSEGWRQEIELLGPNVPGTASVIRATLTWETGMQYGADRVHSRFGCIWREPAHEIIGTYGDIEEIRRWANFQIIHKPDKTKSRGIYMDLLKQGTKESPNSDRNAYYYARELFYYHRYQEAIEEFKRHLALPTAVWPPERASSMRFLGKMEHEHAVEWFTKAALESPGRREPFVDLAEHYYLEQNWEKCLEAAENALTITEKKLDYICEEQSWGSAPWDYAAIAAYNLKQYDKAVKYNEEAIRLDPKNDRLIINQQYYLQASFGQQM